MAWFFDEAVLGDVFRGGVKSIEWRNECLRKQKNTRGQFIAESAFINGVKCGSLSSTPTAMTHL